MDPPLFSHSVKNLSIRVVATSVAERDAASDLVSALIAGQFATHAEMYQAVGAMATEVHSLLLSTLAADAGSYAAAEAANLTSLG